MRVTPPVRFTPAKASGGTAPDGPHPSDTGMPIEVHYTEDHIGLVLCAVGKITGQDIIDAQKKIYASAHFVKLKYWIVDRARCTEYAVTADDVARIASMDKEAAKRNPHMLVALVSHTDLQFGISRMYEAHIDENGFKAMSFRNRAAAERWIRHELRKARHD